MDRTAHPSIVAEFYGKALTVNPWTTPTAVLERLLADDFVSVNGQETKPKATLIRQVEGFWKLIPDLTWAIQDVLVDGDRFVVRSIASGSPKGPFMGMSLDGSRTFRIDTIDIHEVREGRLARAYHIEDWMTAIRQLG